MRCNRNVPHPAPRSHNNSQHVLAIVDHGSDRRIGARVLEEFGKTSELPCDAWRDETGSIVLASNYPGCILEGRGWCVLCAGFAYRHGEAFEDATGDRIRGRRSFAQILLDFCESRDPSADRPSFERSLGRRLRRCSGHFSVYVLRGGSGDGDAPRLWAWNDPFGFMPVYCCQRGNVFALSSYWDCLVPVLASPRLDWDIVAEYIVLGTTLGGGGHGAEGDIFFDRTFVRGIRNLGPGTLCFLRPMPSGEGLQVQINRYVECYGACEELVVRNDSTFKWNASEIQSYGNHSASDIRGVKVSDKSNKMTLSSPSTSSSNLDGNLCKLLFSFIMECVQETQCHATRAALTGGGDTRLILSCLLLIQQQYYGNAKADNRRDYPIIFQTHSKQQTDWQIARHLALMFRLKHRRINPVPAIGNRSCGLFQGEGERLLSILHDQAPLRRKQNLSLVCKCSEESTSVVEYTLHGRFGTEFLGCFCYYKSPLHISTREDLEKFCPKATSLFRAAFGPSGEAEIQNPADTLRDRFQQLTRDKMAYNDAQKKDGRTPLWKDDSVTFDVAYAFQLQLYTRSGLSDIYKGLRGGSWFSIPAAQFTRNAITPFLDNRLLQCMICGVPEREKEEPYRLYAKLYRSGAVPDVLLRVPSNNKLLCAHSGIPHALKWPEAKTRPYVPKLVNRSKGKTPRSKMLEENFHPVFWKGAIAIFKRSPIVMDPESALSDCRPEVQEFLHHVGGDAGIACTLSGRLQSFLLWYERRFVCHFNENVINNT